MKLTFKIFIAVVLFANYSFAQTKLDPPVDVKTAFTKKYPSVTNIKWEKEGDKYEAAFKIGERFMSVLINNTGVIEETEIQVNETELPSAARKYANTKGHINEAAKIVLADSSIHYEAEVKGKDYFFDKKGTFIESKAVKD